MAEAAYLRAHERFVDVAAISANDALLSGVEVLEITGLARSFHEVTRQFVGNHVHEELSQEKSG